MRISIRHELRFTLEPDTAHAVQHLLLTPADTDSQKVVTWSIKAPGIDNAARFLDAFGNVAHLVSQHRPIDDLFVAVTGEIDTCDTSGVIGRPASDPLPTLFTRITGLTRPNGNLVNRLRAQQKAGANRVALLHWLMGVLHDAREAGADDDEDAPDIVAEDHAHVFVAAARGMDIPARFVTGYVLPDDGSDEASLHCWAEAFDDGLGWIGFDPSVNLCPTERYVRLATGLDAIDTVPVRRVPNLAADGEQVRIAQVMMANQQQ